MKHNNDILIRELNEERQKVIMLESLIEDKTRNLYLALESAKKAEQEKNEFFMNISHELKTPIHILMNSTEIALEELSNGNVSEASRYLEAIRESSTGLFRLISDLLELSKREIKNKINKTNCNLNDIIINSITLIEPLAKKKLQQVDFTPLTDKNPTVCDPARIQQVLVNLLNNSVKFSPDGGAIRVELNDEIEKYWVSVLDNGPGVPEKEKEQIFDTFFQSSSTKSGAGGSGLGLSICKEIINGHEGEILAMNRPEGGACISFSLPKQVGVS